MRAMSLLIIMGAGASFDSVDPAITPVPVESPQQPPLARDLFGHRYVGAAAGLPDDVIGRGLQEMRRAVANDEDVEAALQALQDQATAGHTARVGQLMALRYYIQAVIDGCGPWAGHGYTNQRILLDHLESWQRTVDDKTECALRIVTFNYDRLIESAIRAVFGLTFGSFGDYIKHDAIRLWKLHGSVDWRHASARTFRIHDKDPLHQIVELADQLAVDPDAYMMDTTGLFQEMQRLDPHTIEARVLLPALALPFKKKAFECPTGLVSQLDEDLASVDRVLAIGWRAGEAHFLEKLTAVQRNFPVLVVGNTDAGIAEAAANLGTHFRDIYGYSGGFSAFTRQRAVEWFIRDDLNRFAHLSA